MNTQSLQLSLAHDQLNQLVDAKLIAMRYEAITGLSVMVGYLVVGALLFWVARRADDDDVSVGCWLVGAGLLVLGAIIGVSCFFCYLPLLTEDARMYALTKLISR